MDNPLIPIGDFLGVHWGLVAFALWLLYVAIFNKFGKWLMLFTSLLFGHSYVSGTVFGADDWNTYMFLASLIVPPIGLWVCANIPLLVLIFIGFLGDGVRVPDRNGSP